MSPPRKSVAHLLGTWLFAHGTWIHAQIAHLREWRAFVICNDTANLEEYPVERIYSLGDRPRRVRLYNRAAARLLGYPPLFQQALRRERADVIQAHFGPNGFMALGLAARTRTPLVTTFYGSDLSRLPRWQPVWRERYRRLFGEGSLFLVEGPHMREQLIELGCPGEKVQVRHLGVDLGRLAFAPRRPAQDGRVGVLAVGTLTEKKGMCYAVEAFARVSARRDAQLTLVADPALGEHSRAVLGEIEEIIARYGVGERVRMTGAISYEALIREYQRHHVLLAPSVQAEDGDNEGGAPVTVIEASATGLPVVATRHCDIPEVVADGESGYLVPERDVDALAERLDHLVAHPELWAPMGAAGRRRTEAAFDAVKQVRELERWYDSLSGASQPE